MTEGKKERIVDLSTLSDMLYGEAKYMKDFAEAGVESFSEFRDNYSKHLLQRNETEFRKAGHKIKPVALMLKVDQIVEEYEHAKTLIWEEKPQPDLEASSEKVTTLCNQVITELEDVIGNGDR